MPKKVLIARHFDVNKVDKQGNPVFADALELVNPLGMQRKDVFVSKVLEKKIAIQKIIVSPLLRAFQSGLWLQSDLYIPILRVAIDFDDFFAPISINNIEPTTRELLQTKDFIFSNFEQFVDEDDKMIFRNADQAQKDYWEKISQDLHDPIKLLDSQNLVHLLNTRLLMLSKMSNYTYLGQRSLPRSQVEEVYNYSYLENVQKVRRMWEYIATYPEETIAIFTSARTGKLLDEIVQGLPVSSMETLIKKFEYRPGECIIIDLDSEGKVTNREVMYPEVTTGKETEQPLIPPEGNIPHGIEG